MRDGAQGLGPLDMTITGRASVPAPGRRTAAAPLRELARQILDLEAMTDYDDSAASAVVVGMAERRQRAQRGAGARHRHHRFACAAAASTSMAVRQPRPAAHAVRSGLPRRGDGRHQPAALREECRHHGPLFEHAKACAAEIGFVLEDTPLTGGVSAVTFLAGTRHPDARRAGRRPRRLLR